MKTDFTDSSSFTKQKYPVTDPDPDHSKIVDNIKTADILTFLPGFVAWGYLTAPSRRTLVAGGLFTVFTGYHYAYQASHDRLTEAFKPKNPVIDPKPGFFKIVDNIHRAEFASFVPIFATLGYFMAEKPAMRGRTMVFSGLVGGFYFASLASYSRLTGFMKNDDEIYKESTTYTSADLEKCCEIYCREFVEQTQIHADFTKNPCEPY